MRRCTGNTSPRTLTSSTGKPAHQIQKGGLYGQHPHAGGKRCRGPATLLPRARFRPADGGPSHRQSPYRLDGGISALAAAPSSWPAGQSGRVCRRHRHRLYHRDSQDGADFPPISELELENAVNWFFSVDNINAASDRVLQLMDRLELPKLLQRTPGRSHTSSDGQKFEVRVDSLRRVKVGEPWRAGLRIRA